MQAISKRLLARSYSTKKLKIAVPDVKVPDAAKSKLPEHAKSTAAFSIDEFAQKTLENTPVDDVYGTGPKTLENLANLSSKEAVKLPNITFAHQLIGLYLLDEQLYDNVMLKVQGLQQNREHIKDCIRAWCNQHGIKSFPSGNQR